MASKLLVFWFAFTGVLLSVLTVLRVTVGGVCPKRETA